MFRRTCSLLENFPKPQIAEWLGGIDTVICCSDGVLWKEDEPIDGAVDAFNGIKAKGKRSLIVSNDTSVKSSDLVKRANAMGFRISQKNVLNPAGAISGYLKDLKFNKKVFICGSRSLADELKAAGISSRVECQHPEGRSAREFALNTVIDPEVGAVLMSQDDDMDMRKMIVACNYLHNPRVHFLSTGTDKFAKVGEHRIPDVGCLVDAIETIILRKPTILGKPNPRILGSLLKTGEIKPEKTLVIGNSLKSDILFASVCGFQSLLIGCENEKLQKVQKIMKDGDEEKQKLVPDTFMFTFAPLMQFLCA
ncbi:hypothetical protein KR009_006467, partial [Drosophila setifemur]